MNTSFWHGLFGAAVLGGILGAFGLNILLVLLIGFVYAFVVWPWVEKNFYDEDGNLKK